jgi:hypothetical protein
MFYTHEFIRDRAAVLHARIEALETEYEDADRRDDHARCERISDRIERAERELDSLSMIDHDPAAHGLGHLVGC